MLVAAMIHPGQDKPRHTDKRDPTQTNIELLHWDVHARFLKVRIAAPSKSAKTPTANATNNQ